MGPQEGSRSCCHSQALPSKTPRHARVIILGEGGTGLGPLRPSSHLARSLEGDVRGRPRGSGARTGQAGGGRAVDGGVPRVAGPLSEQSGL